MKMFTKENIIRKYKIDDINEEVEEDYKAEVIDEFVLINARNYFNAFERYF